MLCVYVPLMNRSWGIYAAICAGYSVLVLGMLWSDGKWAVYVARRKRAGRELIQGHLVFVLVLVLWMWICQFAKSWLPVWIFEFGSREVTLYHVCTGLGIVAIWWAEQSWLAKPKPKNESVISSIQL
jgi:hypothetical protein